MKNFKKFTAFVLALCMLFSLSISAFAAEKTPTGYLTWALDDSGTLSISGNGRIAAFTSAEDQPWHEMRENITSVNLPLMTSPKHKATVNGIMTIPGAM